MRAFEELERQLLQSVAARSRTGRAGMAASLARLWRAGTGRGRLLVVAPLLLVLALAGMAVETRSPNTGAQRAQASLTARVVETPCGACRTLRGQLHGSDSIEQPLAEGAALNPGAIARETRERRGLPVVFWVRSDSEPAALAAGGHTE